MAHSTRGNKRPAEATNPEQTMKNAIQATASHVLWEPQAQGAHGWREKRKCLIKVPSEGTKDRGDLGEKPLGRGILTAQEITVGRPIRGEHKHFTWAMMLGHGCSVLRFTVSEISYLELMGQAKSERKRGRKRGRKEEPDSVHSQQVGSGRCDEPVRYIQRQG